jgi:hypothetical protein
MAGNFSHKINKSFNNKVLKSWNLFIKKDITHHYCHIVLTLSLLLLFCNYWNSKFIACSITINIFHLMPPKNIVAWEFLSKNLFFKIFQKLKLFILGIFSTIVYFSYVSRFCPSWHRFWHLPPKLAHGTSQNCNTKPESF